MELNPQTREDLLQEALAYLRSREQHHPEQRIAWYLRGVKFHLKDIRGLGRSLDSAKRHAAQTKLPAERDAWDRSPDTVALDEGIMSEIFARDIFCVLLGQLQPKDQAILGGLAGGLGVGEIAEMLHVSEMFVVRHRRQIAKLAIRLGISPGSAGTPLPKALLRSSVRKVGVIVSQLVVAATEAAKSP